MTGPHRHYRKSGPGRSKGNNKDPEEIKVTFNIRPMGLDKWQLYIIVLLLIVFTLGLANGLAVLRLESVNIAQDKYSDTTHTTISGNVIDKDTGDNLQGVLITVSGANMSVETDEDGWFTIEDVRTGRIKLSATKTGYKVLVKNLEIDTSSFEKINFELEQGDGLINEDSPSDGLNNVEKGWKNNAASLYITFALFAVFALLLVFYKRFFWITVLFIIISILSVGYIFGSITAGLALILVFRFKDEFKTKVRQKPIETVKRRGIPKRKLTLPPPPPPPPPPGRISRIDGKPLPRPPRKNL